MKVHMHQMNKMMLLVAKHNINAPELVTLVKAVVKIEELDLPFKRNQDTIMKFFTQFRSDIEQELSENDHQKR